MKNKHSFLLFLLILTTSSSAISQSCLSAGITFSSQGQIDSFQINYPGCSQILGEVIIKESSSGNIVNLNGLLPITSIQGDLWIRYNDSLPNLTGLNNLSSVRTFFLTINNELTTLSALSNLTSVRGISILGNYKITSLNGLQNLSSIESGLSINSANGLISLDGLDNLTSLRNLNLAYNDALTSLNALDNLTSLEGHLHLQGNDVLTSLSGLENITSVGSWIAILYHDKLTSLDALQNIHSIGDVLWVDDNDALTSLEGLDNIDYSTITELEIVSCSNLSMCEVKSVCDYIENGGPTIISTNAVGCNNTSEITDACLVPIEEVLSDKQIQIFPNPTSSAIQVQESNFESWEYSIMSVTGVLLKSRQRLENGQIDLSYFPSGLYFIEFKNNYQVFIKKVIKK